MEVVARTEIVRAAARLLQEQGARAVTTRAVAEAAGVQAPAIYRWFGDKDGLLEAVAEHVMTTHVAAKARAETDPDPVADLRAGWRNHIEFGLANPDLFVLMNDPSRGRRSPATQAGAELLRARVHRVAAAGRLRVDERRAVDLVHAAGAGAVLALLSSPPQDRDPALADALFDAVSAEILTETARPDDGDLPLAVAFATVVPRLPGLSEAERGLMAEWLARSISESQRGVS